jgi:membrane protein
MTKGTVVEWIDDDAMTWAAAVACYTVLALAPMLVIAMKVLMVVLHKPAAMQQLQSQAVHWMGPATANAFNEILDEISRSDGAWFATTVSLVIVVISVGGVFAELQHAMNRIWKVKPKPGRALWGFIDARLRSVVVLVVSIVLLLGSVAVTTWMQHLASSLGLGWKGVTWAMEVLVSFSVLTLLFALLYRIVPDARIEWRSTWVGAFISAILFELGRYGLTAYFRFAAPASAFGALGSLAAVLIWIYYSSMIVFFGAEFTQVYAKARGHGVLPSKHAEPLKVCDETETPTPSSAEPSDEPQRPGDARDFGPRGSSYGQVLAPHVQPSSVSSRGSSRVTATMVGLLGLGVGTLIGGFAAARAGFFQTPTRSEIQSTALGQRLRRAERQVARAARVRGFIEGDELQRRITDLEQRATGAGQHPAKSWRERLVQTLTSYV